MRRNLYSHIYYLLRKQDISAVHRLVFPERWHYYAGDPMLLYILENDETVQEIRLTNEGDIPVVHFEVPAHTWMWAKPENGNQGFSLIGCSMTPAFHEEDWEMAGKMQMVEAYPHQKEIWEEFCIG
jgi:predicted cupin superfamily sugar epimerase